MSRFRFRLQKLLDVMHSSERARAADLATAQHAASQAREVRDAILAARTAGLAQVAAAHTQGGNAGELQRLRAVIAQLDPHIELAGEAADTAEVGLAQAQEAFTAAAQARHSLQQLRERRWNEWRAAVASSEQKQMDEIALQRRRNARSGEQ